MVCVCGGACIFSVFVWCKYNFGVPHLKSKQGCGVKSGSEAS